MRGFWALVACTLIAISAGINVYAIESDAEGAAWVAAVVGFAALAMAGVLCYYREEWKL